MGLVTARKNAGLTQADVAEQLGITDSAVAQWETGRTLPKTALLPKLAALYKCTIDELLEKEE
jgi:transcriptional regulator with XRE-family HTH domain